MSQEFVCEAVKPKSRCTFCGSTNYGKGCRFGPKGVHFHPDDVTKCSYCGSTNYGKGCQLNPFEKMHVHGVPYNSMVKEEIDGAMADWYLQLELEKPIEMFKAFQLGLINSVGELVKAPETLEEHAAYNNETKTILKVRKYLGAKVDLIKKTALLESENTLLTESHAEGLQKHLEYEDKFTNLYNQFCQTVQEAEQDGFTLNQIRALIIK